MDKVREAKILRELAEVINRNSMENECNTPDHILAEYLYGQYEQYCKAVQSTINWHNCCEKVR